MQGPSLTPSDNARIYSIVFLGAATLGIGLLCFRVLSPLLAAIAWAIILAVAAQAPMVFLRRKLPKHPNLSAGILTLVIGLLFILPAGLLIGVVTSQVIDVVGRITTRLNAAHVTSFSDFVQMPAVAHILDEIKNRAGMGPGDFQTLAHGFVNRAREMGPALSAKLALSVFDGIMTFLLTLFLLFFFIRDGEAMALAALDLVPMSKEGRLALSLSLGSMLRSLFRGSLLLALAQGFAGGIGWWIAGLSLPALAGAAMAVLSLLPLGGTAIIWLPGSIWAWTSGHHGSAIFLATWGAVVTSFLADSVLRPMLTRGSEELSTLVVILGVFGGLATFGLLGVFIGPLALALAVTLLGALRSQARVGLLVPPTADAPDAPDEKTNS
jgi:predicted PurR-regulated permease PerM